MNVSQSKIRATYVALIFIFFSISFVNAQWSWHGHPQIGFIYDFEINGEEIFLVRAQFEHDINNFSESLIKLDLDGNLLMDDSVVLHINHPSIRSGMTILDDFVVLNNYDLTELKPNQKLIKYYFDISNFEFRRKIEVSKNKGVYWWDMKTVNVQDADTEAVFGFHYRYDDVNANQGELLFQFWSPNLGLEHEDRYEIEDKEGNSVPTPVDLITTDFGYIGAAYYKSKSRYFVLPQSTDTVFANRSHLYCFDHDGNLFDVKEIGQELYQKLPQFYFDVKQIIPSEDGYFVVGSLEIGGTLVYMRLDQNLNVEWMHDMWRHDTTDFAFFDANQFKSILSKDGHIYTAGWEPVSGAPPGDPSRFQKYKYLVKFDPVEREVVWASKLDNHYGQLWDLEESVDGRLFVSGAWDKDGDFIPPLSLDFDSWFIAEVDSLGRIEPIVSISEETNSEPWTVFPNPVNNILRIRANIQNRQTKWRAYDLQGRIYWESQGIVNTVDIVTAP